MYIFFKPHSDIHCNVSFDGIRWYLFSKEAIMPRRQLDRMLYIVENTDNTMVYAHGKYDKIGLVLRLEYDKEMYDLYGRVVKLHSLVESGQTFLMDEKQIREGFILPLKVKLVAYKEPVVGVMYTIDNAEEATREFVDGGTKRTVGCVVVDYEPLERDTDDNTRYRATLWVPDNMEVAPSGKLGSHLAAFADYFGEDPDTLDKALDPLEWVGKVIKVVKWTQKARMIVVMKE